MFSPRKRSENGEKRLRRFCVLKISHICWRVGSDFQGAVPRTEDVGVWQGKKVCVNREVASATVYDTHLGFFFFLIS